MGGDFFGRFQMSAIHVRPQFTPMPLATASTTYTINSSSIGGLLCTGAGTFTIAYRDDQGATVTLPVITGVVNTWIDLPFSLGTKGATIATGAGATGILAV
jgi:hypothetical protein